MLQNGIRQIRIRFPINLDMKGNNINGEEPGKIGFSKKNKS